MKKGILGKKLGMTQIFMADGRLCPVTVVQAGPCPVTQKKTVETDGYVAIQVGFDAYPENRVKKLTNAPQRGIFQKAGVAPQRHTRELRLESIEGYEVGKDILVSVFAAGEHVDVKGVSKGKGTQGPIKRWNQSRGPMAHGSKYHRGLGSMSANTDPARVFKNKKMAGRMGFEKTTVQNLEVVRVDEARNLLLLKGAVPGPKGGLLIVCDTVKA